MVHKENKWLVVKKKYGGLKDLWSFPAGFVDPGETVDEAALREVKEETGVQAAITGIAGLRTGVINDLVSDNMIVFYMEHTSGVLKPAEAEIIEVAYMTKEELVNDPKTSSMIHFFFSPKVEKGLTITETDPGRHFGYTSYKLFDNR
ncbi:NUDIX hydrolase [Pseudalkalibacillus caeni]|uniref:NUDIX hydrolase n=2 Tax=Exobacillus caeni TaxID=2574798 RepID=A0A5R9F8L5_9BACL|nr:NUDIX hydrolase [Pseudalkalibacillus caeni]